MIYRETCGQIWIHVREAENMDQKNRKLQCKTWRSVQPILGKRAPCAALRGPLVWFGMGESPSPSERIRVTCPHSQRAFEWQEETESDISLACSSFEQKIPPTMSCFHATPSFSTKMPSTDQCGPSPCCRGPRHSLCSYVSPETVGERAFSRWEDQCVIFELAVAC